MKKQLKGLIRRTRALSTLAREHYSKWTGIVRPFPGSAAYWERRYESHGTSGAGSYGALAEFKAEILNAFVRENEIQTVIEFGCGDGNQLLLAKYPRYVGLDASRAAIGRCTELFKNDPTKSFFLYNFSCFVDNQHLFSADLALSLDVVYHLVEDDVYHAYMAHLFNSADKYVIVFSSNEDKPTACHVTHRRFTSWIDDHCPDWSLVKTIPNKYPLDPQNSNATSSADFFVFATSLPDGSLTARGDRAKSC